VGDAIAAAAPVASSDVHVDPYVKAVTLLVGGITAAAGVWLLARRSYRAVLFLAGGIAGAAVLAAVTKRVVARPPIEGPADEYSFPSGSVTWSAATAAVLVLLAPSARERALALAAGGTLVLGLAAVIVWEEWHYPSDVIAGWALAAGWVAGLWFVLRQPRAPRAASRLTRPVEAFDTRGEKEEQTAAAPSVPAARRSGGTDTTA
jgi:membrane-associated phospholipid phosphatase